MKDRSLWGKYKTTTTTTSNQKKQLKNQPHCNRHTVTPSPPRADLNVTHWSLQLSTTHWSEDKTTFLSGEKGNPNQDNSPIRTVPAALKFVKDAVIFIQGTKLASKVLMNLFEIFRLMLEIWRSKNKRWYLRKLEHHTWYVSTGLFSILRSQTLTDR